MTLVEAMDLGQAKVATEQVGHRALLEPEAVQAPFAARAYQTVNGNHFQNVAPPGSLPPDWQTLRPKVIQVELLPELATQPARAPLTWPHKPHAREPDTDGRNLAVADIQGQVLFWKERDLLRGRVTFTRKKINRLLPGSFLTTIEFSQIENMALKNSAARYPAVFDNAPVKVLFAVL